MKKFALLALVATMFAACTTDVTEDVAIDIPTPETLTGSFEENSRIQLQNGKTVWTKGDLVSVFYRSNANQQWQYQGETGERSGTLKLVADAEATQEISDIVVIYPYNENYFINTRTYNVQASLPAKQTYLANSYGLDGNIMISLSEYKNFSLKNVCGWLKIQLTGTSSQKVSSITLKGNNGEQVAGEIYINSADASCELAIESGGLGDDMEVEGSIFEDGTILTSVVLDCGAGVALSSTPKSFYIALPPQTFEKGLTIDIACTDGSTMTKSTESEVVITRNTIQPMAAIAYEGVVPEVYELAYTTNDGQPLDPYTTEGFGANFVENSFDAATGKGSLKFDGQITTIPAKAFIACSNLTQINLPVGITAINAEAFKGCWALAVMDIPQGVKSIGNKAFHNCSGVAEITIPSSVTSIGTSSFEGCGGKATINCQINYASSYSYGNFYKAKFAEVVLSDSITKIGNYAFFDCSSLTSVTIPDSVTSIGSHAFYDCSSLTSVTIPDSVTEIGEWAFSSCSSLTSVTIPDSVTSIGERAFYGCSSLTRVDITDLSAWCKISFGNGSANGSANPCCYGAKLYLNGSELTEVTIPSDITEIKDCAFRGCSSLTSVTIPNRVTSIGDYAFRSCSSLTSITIGNRVSSIGEEAFYGCSSLTAFYGKFASEDNRCLIVDGILNSFAPSGLTSYTIPDSVTSIGEGAFENCSSLTSVTIPDSVTEIGYQAFYNCSSLTSVTIGNSVTSIGGYAFENCSSLKEVYCKPTTPPMGGSSMFGWNASGRKIYVPTASVDAYKAKQYWSDYAKYIEPYEF